MIVREKSNFRRRTIPKQFKEIKTMHAHCERHRPRQLVRNAMNHLHSIHNVFVIAALGLLVTLLQPTIVKCDNNSNVLNEIDSGGEVHAKSTLTELSGGRVIGEKWLRQSESPYSLQMDLTVERSGKLFIEPGVTVHVAPMVGITVRGVLTALVSSMVLLSALLFSLSVSIIILFANVNYCVDDDDRQGDGRYAKNHRPFAVVCSHSFLANYINHCGFIL